MAVAAQGQEHVGRPGLSVGMMGMLIFLTSEIMFFGSLFAGYFYLYGSKPEWPPPETQPVEWFPIPFVNTIILFSSGATMHFASVAIQKGRRWGLFGFIPLTVVTIILGALFELGQGWEFIHAHIRFGGTNQFASAFFTLTGFHGAHVLGGLVLLGLVLGRALKGQFSPQHHVFVAAATIYWHFVDVVWAFLFFILYFYVTFIQAK